MSEPPFTVSFHAGQGKGDTVHATLTLNNDAEDPRWLVLRAHLDKRLAEAFEARVVQLCAFDEDPSLRYVQALGTETGCLAFWLGSEASIALDRFAFRSHGGETAFEVWEVLAIHAAGQPVEDCFADLKPRTELASVVEAFKRSTERTHEQKPCPVKLDVIKRWAVSV